MRARENAAQQIFSHIRHETLYAINSIHATNVLNLRRLAPLSKESARPRNISDTSPRPSGLTAT